MGHGSQMRPRKRLSDYEKERAAEVERQEEWLRQLVALLKSRSDSWAVDWPHEHAAHLSLPAEWPASVLLRQRERTYCVEVYFDRCRGTVRVSCPGVNVTCRVRARPVMAARSVLAALPEAMRAWDLAIMRDREERRQAERAHQLALELARLLGGGCSRSRVNYASADDWNVGGGALALRVRADCSVRVEHGVLDEHQARAVCRALAAATPDEEP